MQSVRMDQKTLKAFVCWSGGKESALSLYRAEQRGIKPGHLLNMLSEEGKFSRTHGIPAGMLKAQAQRIGIPLVQSPTSWEDYEKKFKKVVLRLKKEGIGVGVFGDIDLEEHKSWVECICRDMGIKPVLPLWHDDRETLLRDFIRAGFRAIVVSIRADRLNERWLGREIDEDFIQEVKALKDIDLCGEKGEYHTFVFDGPIFTGRVPFSPGNKISRDNYCFLEIKEASCDIAA